MEPAGHGFKSTPRKAIYADGSVRVSQPGNYNIGIDYTKGFGTNVICMYSGTVTQAGFEGGYGNRIHIKLDQAFVFEGKSYDCFQAYAHCLRLLKSVGQRVAQGESIAIEAGHGSSGPNDYGSHVDLDTYCIINGEKYHLNPDLLGRGLKPEDSILPVGVLRKDSEGYHVRWLQMKLGIKPDGVFGSGTEAAVKAFQKQQGDLVIDGEAGQNTCTRLGLVEYAIFPKADGNAVSDLNDLNDATADSFDFAVTDPPKPLFANWVKDEGTHWLFELKEKAQDRFNWLIQKKDVVVVHGYSSTILDLDDAVQTGDLNATLPDTSQGKWDLALEVCPTQGCSSATAQPEGLASGGVASSHEIMRRDLDNLAPEKLTGFKNVGARLKVPVEIILALASRESHLGALLGRFGNNPGWGDRNQAWGILQVDKRFHAIRGLDDPFSEAHIEQAIGIFASYRDQIKRNHPDWDDEFVLKGGCVAYNSGVSNVQTINGMNAGTTHDDYGDDVIARAQFCRGRV